MWLRNKKIQFEATRERFEVSARSYFFWYSFWLYLHYILGLMIVILSALIATDGVLPQSVSVKLLAVISGVIAASVTFLRPNQNAATFRARWLMLNTELLNPKNKKDDLIPLYEAYLKAESMSNGMIVDGEAQKPKPAQNP